MQPTNNRQSKKERAFTLIELLVVIAIVGILAGLAVVNMSGATEAARIAKLKVYSNSIRSSLMGNRVSEWKFDEGAGTTTADTVGTNNGVLTNFNFSGSSNWKTGAECVSGNCLSFDGSNDYVDYNSNPNLNITDTITIEAWVKPMGSTYRAIIGKGDGSPTTESYLFNIGTDNSLQLYMTLNGVGSGWQTSSGTVANSLWSHVVAIYNGSKIIFYINGAKSGELSKTGSIYVSSNNFKIGKQGSATNYFNGSIDEVRIYSAALTASAIRDQYVAGLDKLLAKGQITNEDYQQRIASLNLTYAIDK